MPDPLFNVPGVTDGVIADVLRLEVETDPTGLVNLVENPNGDLGGWGWVTPVAGTTMQSVVAGGVRQLSYTGTTAAANAEYFYTEPMPVVAGHYASARWKTAAGVPTTLYYRAKFEWLDAAQAVIGTSTVTAYLSATAATITYGPHLAPASTAYARLRFDLYANNTGTNPAAGTTTFPLYEVTVAEAATTASLQTVRTNRLTNPSFETNATGWTSGNTGATVARSTAQANTGTASLAITSNGTSSTLVGKTTVAVTGSTAYAVLAYARSATATRGIRVDVKFYNSGGAYVGGSSGSSTGSSTSTWSGRSASFTTPATAVTADILLTVFDFSAPIPNGEVHYWDSVIFEATSTVGTYFDGATPDAAGWDYAWTGTAHASTSTATLSSLVYIPPVPTVDVLDSTFSVSVTRAALNLGTLAAEILDTGLDPAESDLIRPGRDARLSVRDTAGNWQTIATVGLDGATVTYPLLAEVPERKKARIVLAGTDNIATLAAAQRPESVATVAELPYVLEGAGVPWNVNGSGAQVGAATTRSIDDNATALDQVAMTRDTVHAYAWVDQVNVTQVWDAALLDDTPVLTLDEDVYTDPEISYDTDACINEVTVVRRSLDALGVAIEETSTYTDDASIREWGRHSATFTVLAPVVPATFAAAVLAANATPARRITSVTVNVRDETFLPVALLDLYAAVQLVNTEKDIDQLARVTGVTHAITAEKWLIKLSFAAPDSVASPQVIPPLKPGAVGVPYAIGYRTTTAGSFSSGTYHAYGTGNNQVLRGGMTYNLADGVYTVPAAGVYQIDAQVGWAANATAWRAIAITAGGVAHYGIVTAVSGVATIARVSVSVYLTAGATITPTIRQQSGANLALDLTPGYGFISIARTSD